MTVSEPLRLHALLGVVLASAIALPSTGSALLLHFASVRHRVCPEHGQLVHVEGASLPVPGQAGAAPAIFGVAVAADHVHSHCAVTLGVRHASEAVRARSTGPRASDQGAAVCTGCEEGRSAQPVFSLAPKQSPPTLG
jgi:hypothetical protein